MSICTIGIILEKIKVANEMSPVAVFKTERPDGKHLNVVFKNTVMTAKMMRLVPDMFVGEYHNRMDMSDVRKELESAARR